MMSAQPTKGLTESGQLKALSLTCLKPSPAMPGVPTMQGDGVKKARCGFAVLVRPVRPKGLPDAVKAKLESVAT
jgi:tripartite-type tricarboxylate transporter receptor subunit TctC